MHTTFADTILHIAVTGNLVRLDLGTVIPEQSNDGKHELRTTPTQQVVMPLEGFARAFGMQEQIIKKLIADGVLKAHSEPKNQPSISTTNP